MRKIFIRQNLFINQFIKNNWDIKNLHLDILNVIFYNFNINDFIESGLNILEFFIVSIINLIKNNLSLFLLNFLECIKSLKSFKNREKLFALVQ